MAFGSSRLPSICVGSISCVSSLFIGFREKGLFIAPVDVGMSCGDHCLLEICATDVDVCHGVAVAISQLRLIRS